MSADALLATWTRSARLRGASDDFALGLPAVLVVAALTWRLAGLVPAIVLTVAALAVLAAIATRRARRFDATWLARQLDAHRADMEDSADLLFTSDAVLNPLQQLQRDRVARRLDAAATDLRPAWSARRIALAWAAAAIAIAAVLVWPVRNDAPPILAPSAEGVPAIPGVPRLVGQHLRIVPPAYTGLPPRNEARLDARAPVGSRLTWTLRFAPQPTGARLTFLGGRDLPLARNGTDWSVQRTLDRSALYRVLPVGGDAKLPPLHRLDAVPDAPPQIKVIAPDRGLSNVTPGQRRWPLAFEVTDDYGVASGARLRVILAQGEGENIVFKERTIAVAGSGGAKRRTFAPTLDLAAFGFAKGSDLIAQLIVSDNRSPGPQVVRSQSLILRWPADAGVESSALEGMVKKVTPAYLRSQRQIIIDAEKLLKQRRALKPEEFFARSNALGVDQRLLRLRYGQFLGETSEGEPEAPTNDAAGGTAHSPGDGHDHAGSAPAQGSAADVIASVGHTHDESEAATLLDPRTRTLLRQALDNMWGSEGALRLGDPKAALPFAYKALAFIKQVQQADRIYLKRVGPDLPPIDETRRMTGKREGLASRALPLLPQDGGDAVPAATWRALESGEAALGLEQLETWLRRNEARLPDPLAFTGAIDAVRRDPSCAECRRTLRGLLWTALSRPPAQALRRAEGDAEGRRYLDALARTR